MKKGRILRKVSAVLIGCMMVGSFAGCAGTQQEQEQDQADSSAYKVGVIQFTSHASLDNCYEGISNAFDESGLDIEIDFQNGNGSSETCDAIAKTMVSKNYDMIVAIATPAALSAYSATRNTDIPVIFSAVSDPVADGLVSSVDKPDTNASGTRDVLDFNAQIELILSLKPETKNIGVIYTTSETNSISQLESLTDIASGYGVEIVSQGVQSSAEVAQAVATILPKVDCLNNLTDNNVVDNLTVLLEQSKQAGKPVYGSEEMQVISGCLACVGLDYVALGNETGQMAIEVLNGADVATMPVRQITDAVPTVNLDVAEELGVENATEIENATLVTLSE